MILFLGYYQVTQIPETFSSFDHYLRSFRFPLIEEMRADLQSNMTSLHTAPGPEIIGVELCEDFDPADNLLYLIELKHWTDFDNTAGIYEPEVGDLIALTGVRPKCVDDLNDPKRSYIVALVQRMWDPDDETNKISIKPNKILVQSSRPIFSEEEDYKAEDGLFVVYLTNLTTNMRIWKALHPCEGAQFSIINSVLKINPSVRFTTLLCFWTFRVYI